MSRVLLVLTALALAPSAHAACAPNLPPGALKNCILAELETQARFDVTSQAIVSAALSRITALEAALADAQARIQALEDRLTPLETTSEDQTGRLDDLEATRLTQADLDAAGYAPGLADHVQTDGFDLSLSAPGEILIEGTIGVELASAATLTFTAALAQSNAGLFQSTGDIVAFGPNSSATVLINGARIAALEAAIAP